MKVAVIVFLLLCFHLAGKSDCGYASLRDSKTTFFGTVSKPIPAPALKSPEQDDTVIQNFAVEEDELFGIEDDEEETEVSTRKHLRPDRRSSALTDALLGKRYCHRLQSGIAVFNILSFIGSCLYLEQQTLKI